MNTEQRESNEKMSKHKKKIGSQKKGIKLQLIGQSERKNTISIRKI